MKIQIITKLTAGAAFILLASCGQDEPAGQAAVGNETEISAANDIMNLDWIPNGIVLPQPHTVIQDTKIGTRTHLLQVGVENDPKDQFTQWQAALVAAGYEVNDSMIGDGRIQFKGADVESGQIAVSQPEDQNGYMIQIDVSKASQ